MNTETRWRVTDEWGDTQTFTLLDTACVMFMRRVAESYDEDKVTLEEQVITTHCLQEAPGTRVTPPTEASGSGKLSDAFPPFTAKRGGVKYGEPPKPRPEDPWEIAGRELAARLREEAR